MSHKLESTDVAPKVPHLRPTWDAASNAIARTSIRVCVFFFFSRIRVDSARFVPNQLRFAPNRLWFAPNRADSAKIGSYRQYRVISAGSRNRPKNGRNMPETVEIGLEYGWKSRNLPSSFFFCESRHSMCFLRIF